MKKRIKNNPITHFEITTIAALLAFAEQKADITLLETGLGGRLDATNVIDSPLLTIITSISMDHMQFLGNTIEEIAFEKAGIIKKNTPCVAYPKNAQAEQIIIEVCKQNNAPLYLYNRDWTISKDMRILSFQDDKIPFCPPSLQGEHQIDNAALAIISCHMLKKEYSKISNDNIIFALKNTKWKARLQNLNHTKLSDHLNNQWDIWLDGGHNDAAGKALKKQIQQWKKQDNLKTIIIFGMLKTKEINNFLNHLKDDIDTAIAVTIPNETDSLTAQQTKEICLNHHINTIAIDNLKDAFAYLNKIPPARVLICGSLYLASAISKMYDI